MFLGWFQVRFSGEMFLFCLQTNLNFNVIFLDSMLLATVAWRALETVDHSMKMSLQQLKRSDEMFSDFSMDWFESHSNTLSLC